MGGIVSYHDPHVLQIRKKREFPEFEGRASVELDYSADLWLILTSHDEFKEIPFEKFSGLIVDTRNIVNGKLQNVYKA
jgi:UDP-N-acetyl-D-mannosaminuronate dehydrogenase